MKHITVYSHFVAELLREGENIKEKNEFSAVFQTRAVFFRQQLVPPLLHVMPRRNVITGRLTGTYHAVTLQRSVTAQTQSKGVFDLAKPKPVSL